MNIANNVITGMGICGAGYKDIASFEALLRHNRVSIQRHQRFPECTFPAAQIGAIASKDDVICDLDVSGISPGRAVKVQKMLTRYGVVYQSALSAMMQAWQQAGLCNSTYRPDEIALIVAGQNLNLNEQYQAFKKFTKAPEYVSPGYAQHFIDTSLMSFLTELFMIHGGGFNISAATASGNMGIMQALKTLDDEIKCCIVLGPMADLSPVELQGFYNAGALGGDAYLDNPAQASRPFDAAHNGFIYGQGCACLVLERLRSAEKRQQPVLTYIHGAASYLSAYAGTEPDSVGEVKVMQKILTQAHAPRIDYINAHGTGTPLGDDVEAKAIEEVFQNKPYINATKSLIGHTLWSAAVIECIACIIQLRGGFMHGNVTLDNPVNSQLNFVGKQGIQHPIQCALSLSYGFGGINTALLLSNNCEKNCRPGEKGEL